MKVQVEAKVKVQEELENALARLQLDQLTKEYWAGDEFLCVPQFLSPMAVSFLMEDVQRLVPSINRNFIPGHKKGGSVSYFSIAQQGPALLALYDSVPFLEFLKQLTQVPLVLCPESDPHRCALYFYTEAGDHIGYHYDTSYYRGARYTVLIGLEQKSTSRLLCRLHTRRPQAKVIELSVATEPGSMVVFNGDKVYHAVSPLREGERRVVLTMEYVTDIRIGKFQKIFSDLKDAFAYFGIQSLRQGEFFSRKCKIVIDIMFLFLL